MSLERLFLIALLLIANSLGACAFREEKPQEEEIQPRGSFAAIQTSALGEACIRCHNPSVSRGGVDLTTYAAVIENPGLVVPGNAELSRLYQVVFSGEMPPRGPRLSDEAIELIRDWINDGAIEGAISPVREPQPVTPPPGPPVDPPLVPPVTPPPGNLPEPRNPTYTYIYENILEPKCARCHTGSEPAGFVDVSSYRDLLENVFIRDLIVPGRAEESVLFQVLIDTNPRRRMPARSEPLSGEEIELIRQWINSNAPEDI